MSEIVIVEAVRSAVGRALKGSLSLKRPDELAGDVIRGLLARVPGVRPEQVDDVVLGCAMPEGEQGLNVARLAAILGGLPVETSAMTINRFCSSGLQAIALAAGSVALGHHDIVIAGGVESMSTVPMTGNKISASPELMEAMPGAYTPMGITAENVAKKYGVSRADQDALAAESHRRAQLAIDHGYFRAQVVPVPVRVKRDTVPFESDETVRGDATVEKLGKLKPVFDKAGTVTAGNASSINDAAAALVLADREVAEKKGLRPMGRLVAHAYAGVDPKFMGMGPVPAVQKLFAKTGLKVDDIDVFEVNEAFAAQALAVCRELGLPPARTNPNGSGISLGHPIGATGAILVIKALYELARTGGRRALVTMCIGGGQGIAALLEHG